MEGIAQRITQQRTQLGISIRGLARTVRVSPETIRKIETGETKSPGVLLLGEIAHALDVDLVYLVYGPEADIELKQSGNVIEFELPENLKLDGATLHQLAQRLALEFSFIREQYRSKS